MGNRIKKAFIILSVFLLCGALPGCYDSREIDDMAYVVAIGFDKGKTNFLKLTLQIAIPQGARSGDGAGAGAGGGAGGVAGGGESRFSTITTVETPTLYAGLNMVNNYISKQINLSHAKALVFSKELAESGDMRRYMHAIMRGREFRPNAYVVVSRDSAEEYIKSVNPVLSLNSAKYYELNYRGYNYTGFTANTQLNMFYYREGSSSINAVAILAGVGRFKSSKDFDSTGSTYKNKDRSLPLEGDFKAGDIPKLSDSKAEIMGLAVFDGETMSGELDGEETTFHLMTAGQFNYAFVSIPDPIKKDMFVVLNMKQSRKPVHKVDITGRKPKINVKVLLEADILSIQSGINYEKTENRHIIEEAAEDYLKKGIERYLDRTAKELHSDICGFGKVVKGRFLTWNEWQSYNWLGRYKDSTFKVEVDLKIRRTGLIIRSMPAFSSKGVEMY